MTAPGEIARAASLAGLAVLGAGAAMCMLRILRGPSPFDRALAFDCLVLDVAGAVLLLSVLLGTAAFIDAVLIIALVGFLGTVSLAAYAEGSPDD